MRRMQGECKEYARRMQGECKENARRMQGECKENARRMQEERNSQTGFQPMILTTYVLLEKLLCLSSGQNMIRYYSYSGIFV